MDVHGPVLAGWYYYRMVGVLPLIAIVSAFVTLLLARRVRATRGASRVTFVSASIVALGLGIWLMHHVVMAAVKSAHWGPTHAISISGLSLAAIGMVTFVVLGVAISIWQIGRAHV